jgi:hypothetical protein
MRSKESDVALEQQVHILRHPYPDTIPDEEFRALLDDAVRARAIDIEARHAAGEFERDRMSFTILDPTAPAGALADDIVLAIVIIGEGGDFFAPNAMAKAFCLRDHGHDGNAVVPTQNHRLADGSFRHGGAVEVAGTIVGGSGQTPLQDRYQSTLLAADLNYAVAMARLRWEEAHGPGRWYLNEQAPDRRFSRIVEKALGG